MRGLRGYFSVNGALYSVNPYSSICAIRTVRARFDGYGHRLHTKIIGLQCVQANVVYARRPAPGHQQV